MDERKVSFPEAIEFYAVAIADQHQRSPRRDDESELAHLLRDLRAAMDPRRQRLRALCADGDRYSKPESLGVVAKWAREVADDLGAPPYEVELATVVLERALVRDYIEPIDRAANRAATEVEKPSGIDDPHCMRSPHLLLAALDAVGMLSDVLVHLRLSVAEQRGAVVIMIGDRVVCAISADEWRSKLAAARRAE